MVYGCVYASLHSDRLPLSRGAVRGTNHTRSAVYVLLQYWSLHGVDRTYRTRSSEAASRKAHKDDEDTNLI
jgi:hypothetical protein